MQLELTRSDLPGMDACTVRLIGQGDSINGSISPVDVAAVCVAALQDPAASGVTFEIVDEWAKALEGNPDGKPEGTPSDDTEPVSAAAVNASNLVAGSGGDEFPLSFDAQLRNLFVGLVPDGVPDAEAADTTGRLAAATLDDGAV